jgi:hypothetical protein
LNISSSHITDLDQDPSFESYENHNKFDEPQDTNDDLTSHVHNPTPSKIHQRYKPLKFPFILHDFPSKHVKYLLKFDGEIKNIMTEKHIQDFEYFIDMLEIEQDDVCMRTFSQSLQGYAKAWFNICSLSQLAPWMN